VIESPSLRKFEGGGGGESWIPLQTEIEIQRGNGKKENPSVSGCEKGKAAFLLR